MKKYFQIVGMISLICFSFFYTEKTSTVLKEKDEIMMELKEKSEVLKTNVTEATIEGKTIIPGFSGKQVDINGSYKNLKRIGFYNEKYVQFEEIKPKELLKNHLDKYIIAGNKKKNMVSLLFLVEENTNIENVLKIMNEKDMKATFFVDTTWFEKNSELAIGLIKQGHTFGNLSYQGDTEDSTFIWMNTVLKKVGMQEEVYCYTEEENENLLKACSMHKNYTIKPTFTLIKYPLIEVKNSLKAGSLIAIPINPTTEKELELILKYITSKGYIIEDLKTHLKES